VNFLLDTSTWIWSTSEPERLSKLARDLLGEREHHLFHLSAASAWEIAIKSSLGKLKLPAPAAEYVPATLIRQAIRSLPVTTSHAVAVEDLPFHHNDPFDRLLIAQAKLEGLIILTSDTDFRRYAVKVVW
jgi:PIN domain nuclease of toxin-antitoxin system